MVGLTSDRIEEIREKMEVYKGSGLDPIKAISNSEDGLDLLKHFLDTEGIKLFESNVKDSSQYTMLEKLFEFLYNIFGAEYKIHDVNSLDQNGQGVLHSLFASSNMLKEVVDRFGADINIQNKYGETVLMKSAEYGRGDSVEYLISEGADVTKTNNKGQNLLHMLAEQFKERDMEGQLQTIDILQMNGDLDKLLSQKDNKVKTPLDYARENQHSVANQLIEKFTLLSMTKGPHSEKILSENQNKSKDKGI